MVESAASVELTYEIAAEGWPFLIAKPFDTRHQLYLGVEPTGADIVGEIANQVGGQCAFLVEPKSRAPVTLRFDFSMEPGEAPSWLASGMVSRWFAPSDALRAEILALVKGPATPDRQVRDVMEHVGARFEYGHPERHLAEGEPAMPALVCESTLGSCVDIHSYAIAALAALGIRASYLSGVYLEGEAGPGAAEPCTLGHCWMESYAGNAVLDWDIAHFLRYRLGGPVRPGLNPRPGRRIAMQSGRGHVFALEDGAIEIDRAHAPVFAAGDDRGCRIRASTSILWLVEDAASV